MVKRIIVFAAVVLIIGLSLLAIQCTPGSKAPLKGIAPNMTEQIKMPLKGPY
jgi:hypothetical protein